MPKLSVIVPVYNVEKYLKECINSIINQTLKDIEIICVNDGSTDNSLKILEELSQLDNRIKIINKENGGLASARNAGMKVASGEYYTFIDSDDFIDTNAYETVINKKSEADIICFGIQVFGNENSTQKKYDDTYYKIKYNGLQKLTDDIIFNTDVSACNKVFKSDIINKNNITFPDGLNNEDAEFYCKYMSCATTAYFIDKYFYHYRRTNNSIMSDLYKGSPKAIHHLYILKNIFEFWENNNYLTKHINLFSKIFISFLDFAYRNSTTDMKKEVLKVANEYAKTFDKKLNIKIFTKIMKKNRYKTSLYKKIKNKIRSIVNKKTNNNCHPKISVIMPVYNAQEYIREAIDSILNQTFSDFEFIIINDGSTDNSVEIIKNYNDPRIVLVDNTENKGLVSVLNQGLQLAQGEYIARMDADDISLPNRFMEQVNYLDKHPQVGILGAWFHIFGNKINRIEKKHKFPKLKDILETSPVGHPVAMLRKSVFDKYNLQYDKAYKHAEDYELWVRASKLTKIANLQKVLLKYRWHDNNISAIYEKEQSLTSFIIKQKIRQMLNIKKFNIDSYIDDTQLLNEFKDLPNFSYMPNSGNMGDMFIAGATMRWFDKNKLNWQRYKEGEIPKNFVYGGGGAWLHEWIEFLQPTMEIMKKAEKVIILPSSFNNVPEFVEILDEHFIVFCREKKSYNYLISQNTKAKILLDHDMAFRMCGKINLNLKAPTKQLKTSVKKLNKDLAKFENSIHFFRKDSESLGLYETDYDLSDSLGWFSQYEPREHIDFAITTMLNAVYRFNSIETDRLHVGIAGTLMGTNVTLYDNSYGKISGVYEQTLHKFPNVKIKNGEK